MRKQAVLLALAVVLVFVVSPLAADPVIRHGIDAFTTTANGKTFYSFAATPIPAGFFCKSSAPFTGRVAFKGLPLETAEPGGLHGADTVIERLDDAVFDATGTAETRIQFRALSLVSVAPIKTGCGAFHVYASLAGKQHETTMRIYRTEDGGGHFLAPLAVNVKLSFIPVKPARGKAARRLELTGDFTFPASPISWSLTGGADTKRLGSVLVDTNGDLNPDTVLFGTSNFWPGWSPEGQVEKSCRVCEPQSCHTDPPTGKQHCTGPITACTPAACP